MILFNGIDQSKRLKSLRKHLDLNQEEFAALLGVSQGYYSELERNQKQLSRDIIENIANCFMGKTEKILSLDWLMYGTGGMFIAEDTKKIINGDNGTVNIQSNNSGNAVIKQEDNRNFGSDYTVFEKEIEYLKRENEMLKKAIEDKELIINLLQKK